jgi:hypothetical protein
MSKSAVNTYIVYFRSDLQWGRRDLKAGTPEQALAEARRLAKKDWDALDLDYFEPCDCPVNDIEVLYRNTTVAVWLEDDMRLRLAAPDLLAAAEKVVARWAQGDLADAVRELSAAIDEAKGGAA